MTKCENCYHKKVCIDSANYKSAENCRQYKDKNLIAEFPEITSAEIKELINITVTIYFEVRNSCIWGGMGSVGYPSITFQECRIADSSDLNENFLKMQIKTIANTAKVMESDVRVITKREYEEKQRRMEMINNENCCKNCQHSCGNEGLYCTKFTKDVEFYECCFHYSERERHSEAMEKLRRQFVTR